MNLFDIINNGIAHSGSKAHLASRRSDKQNAVAQKRAAAVTATREKWLYALQVDETRGWMSLYETQPEVLKGLVTVLSLVALAKEHDAGNLDSPDVRVIRGAVSAATQAADGGSVLSPETLKALSSAAGMARQILSACTDAAIERACTYLSGFLKLQGA